MSDPITTLAAKAYDAAVNHFELMRTTAARDVLAHGERIMAAASNLPPPTYDQIDQSRQLILDMTCDPALPPSYRNFFASPEGDLSPMFANPLEPAAIQGLFEGMIGTTIRSIAAGERTVHLGRIFESALLMIGGFAMIPSGLQPSASISFITQDVSRPEAVWDASQYKIDVNVTMEESTGASVFASMLHEFRHLLQYLRSVQFGNAYDLIIVPSLSLAASANVYLPPIREDDPNFGRTMDYFSTLSENIFLRIIGAKMMTLMLEAAPQQELRTLAGIFGIKTSLRTDEIALRIYSEIDLHLLGDFDKFASALSSYGISTRLIETIRTIALQKYAVYRLDPKESEVRGWSDFGLALGNPALLLETASGERALHQTPLDETLRKAFYADLALSAQMRQSDIAAGNVDFLVRDLIGGSGSVVTSAMPVQPAQLIPEYRDVDALQRRLTERTDRIAEAAGKSARLIEMRIRK